MEHTALLKSLDPQDKAVLVRAIQWPGKSAFD